MKRVIVHIERLVLKGLPEEAGRSVPEAIQRELALQFGDGATLARLESNGPLGTLSLGKITLGSIAAAEVGDRVAQGIQAGIAKNKPMP